MPEATQSKATSTPEPEIAPPAQKSVSIDYPMMVR